MISGANYLLVFDFPQGVTGIDKIVFTLTNQLETVTKNYPATVSYSSGQLIVPLTQEDTKKLTGYVDVEAQINFSDKAVAKKRFNHVKIDSTLATELVTGNSPSGNSDASKLKFEFDGDVVIAKVEGDIDPDEIAEAVADYLEEHPVETGITEEQCEQIVADYVDEHKDELKGDKGDKGDTGAQGAPGATPVKGVDYFTEADKAEMVAAVLTQVTDGNEVAY